MTQTERVFVEHYAATGDTVYAATRAGVARPSKDAARMLDREQVRQAVSVEVHRRLDGLVMLTLDRFEKMMRDVTTPNKDVIAIGKATLTHWGAQSAGAADSKDPSELSGAELQGRIAKLQAEAAARAKPIIDIEPDQVSDPDDEGVLD